MALFRTDHPLTTSFDLVKPSLQLLRRNIWAVFYLSFLPSLVIVVGTVLITGSFKSNGTIDFNHQFYVALGVIVTGMILILVTLPGLLTLHVRAARGETPGTWECLKAGLPRLPALIGEYVLFELAIVIGFFLLIVPGLIILRSFYLAQYYVIDQNLGPMDALKKSRAESIPNSGPIWGVIGVLLLFSIAGSVFGILPVVGRLFTLAFGLIYSFAPVLRYIEIKKLKLPVDTEQSHATTT